jgi:hypothetical protein
MRQSYYVILLGEHGAAPEEKVPEYATAMLAAEEVPLGLLAGIVPSELDLEEVSSPNSLALLEQEIAAARKPLERRLERVTHTIIEAAGRPDVTCTLAAAMGTNAGVEVRFRAHDILIGPSLVLLAQSEDALAFVVGHEVAHIMRNHIWPRALPHAIFRLFMFGYDPGPIAESAADILAHGGLSAFARDKECEADYYGLQLMTEAGYEPEVALRFWRLLLSLQDHGGGFEIPFLSTHPTDAERVLRLARWTDLEDQLWRDAGEPLLSTTQAFANVRTLSVLDALQHFGVVTHQSDAHNLH